MVTLLFLFASRNAEALPKHLALIMRCFTFVQHDVWKFLIGTLMGPDCFYIRSAGKIFSLRSKILIHCRKITSLSFGDLDTLPWAGCSNKKRFFALTGSEPFFNSITSL